ncbi:MAG: helix-turn-helix domain-containing protein [Planctomycetota bacterium]
MLPIHVIREIHRLLDQGELSQRSIAQRLGVSRGTVGAIAAGRRGIHGRTSDDAAPQRRRVDQPVPARCPTCGGRVYSPCVLCRARRFRQLQRRFRPFDSSPSEQGDNRRVA